MNSCHAKDVPIRPAEFRPEQRSWHPDNPAEMMMMMNLAQT